MRTTLTLDPDVARLLEEEVHRRRRPFKQVVNDALRRALSPGGKRPMKRFSVEPFPGAFVPGIDPLHLNRASDELENEALARKLHRGR